MDQRFKWKSVSGRSSGFANIHTFQEQHKPTSVSQPWWQEWEGQLGKWLAGAGSAG